VWKSAAFYSRHCGFQTSGDVSEELIIAALLDYRRRTAVVVDDNSILQKDQR